MELARFFLLSFLHNVEKNRAKSHVVVPYIHTLNLLLDLMHVYFYSSHGGKTTNQIHFNVKNSSIPSFLKRAVAVAAAQYHFHPSMFFLDPYIYT